MVPNYTREQWEEAGREYIVRERGAGWRLAWWLVEGREWDKDFEVSARLTGYSRTHLWNLYRVGFAFPPGTAHSDLSIAVHRELLREPDRNQRALVLSHAIENNWTADDVVRWFEVNPPTKTTQEPVDAAVRPRRMTKTEYSRKYYVGQQVRCPACGHVHSVKGNKVARDEQPASASDSSGGAIAGDATRPLPDGPAREVSAAPATPGDA